MNKSLQIISISLLLLTATGSAWAAPGWSGPGERDGWVGERRVERQQRAGDRQDFRQRREVQVQRQSDYRRSERGASPGSRAVPPPFVVGPQQLHPYDSGSDGARRPGRMTPEERTRLRREINEAGRDIYGYRR